MDDRKFSAENANSLGNPEAVRESRSVGTLSRSQLNYRYNLAKKSSYFKESRTLSAYPPLVPERQSFREEGMDLEGFEPSPATLTGSRAAITPQAHGQEHRATWFKTALVDGNLRARRFVLGIAAALRFAIK